jgi:murein DD-endopeptidase MepM/ murein hydrolase activator NlpD
MKRMHPVYRPPLRHPRWLPWLAALPLFGVVAAFGIAPDTVTTPVQTEAVVQAVELPEAAVTETPSYDYWTEERIRRGETLHSLLTRLGVTEEERARFIKASREAPDLGRLVPGRTVLARVTADGHLLLFRYLASEERLITVNRVQEEFVAEQSAVQLENRPIMRSGEIKGSLYGATDAADIPDSIASQMAEVFSGDIDFHRDLRRGDRFSVVYEAFYHNGSLVKTGRLLAAEFVNEGQAHRALHFKDAQGREGYFTPDGRSMKRAFLKSPIPFSRISSGFSISRYHPVLKEWRAHKGIDYAAPTGTPIRAVADATVSFAGRQGGYGNIVILNHQKPYTTAYGHLSRFAKGIRSGARVSQGDIIGYVGATGLASGPHLHYEFRVGGVQKNPLALNLPTAFPLDARQRARFSEESRPLLARLEMLRGSNLASFD